MTEAGDYLVVWSRVGRPGWCLPHWRAELFEADDFCSHPLGVAYVTDSTDTPMKCAMIDYLIIFDQWRNEGHARRLVRACHERFPGIEHTGRLTAAGEFRPGH